MGGFSVRSPSFLVRNIIHLVVFIAILLIRRLIFKVSYPLWISSIIALMTWLVIFMSICYNSVDQKTTPRNGGLSDHV